MWDHSKVQYAKGLWELNHNSHWPTMQWIYIDIDRIMTIMQYKCMALGAM